MNAPLLELKAPIRRPPPVDQHIQTQSPPSSNGPKSPRSGFNVKHEVIRLGPPKTALRGAPKPLGLLKHPTTLKLPLPPIRRIFIAKPDCSGATAPQG